jgi:hypothetical protein
MTAIETAAARVTGDARTAASGGGGSGTSQGVSVRPVAGGRAAGETR